MHEPAQDKTDERDLTTAKLEAPYWQIKRELLQESQPKSVGDNHFDPKLYTDNSVFQKSAGLTLMDAMNVQSGEVILDVGCGDGKLTMELANRAQPGQVVGMDISEKMIAAAREHSASNLTFEIADVQSMPYNHQFDKVFSCCCLHWVKNLPQALTNIKKSFKEDGRAFLLIPTTNEIDNAILELIKTEKWRKFFEDFTDTRNYFDKDYLYECLQESQLDLSNFKEVVRTPEYDSREKLKDFFRSVSQHMAHLPENAREAFLDDLVDCIPKENLAAGRIKLTIPLIEVVGQRKVCAHEHRHYLSQKPR